MKEMLTSRSFWDGFWDGLAGPMALPLFGPKLYFSGRWRQMQADGYWHGYNLRGNIEIQLLELERALKRIRKEKEKAKVYKLFAEMYSPESKEK